MCISLEKPAEILFARVDGNLVSAVSGAARQSFPRFSHFVNHSPGRAMAAPLVLFRAFHNFTSLITTTILQTSMQNQNSKALIKRLIVVGNSLSRFFEAAALRPPGRRTRILPPARLGPYSRISTASAPPHAFHLSPKTSKVRQRLTLRG
jgi:hypothetical protein